MSLMNSGWKKENLHTNVEMAPECSKTFKKCASLMVFCAMILFSHMFTSFYFGLK